MSELDAKASPAAGAPQRATKPPRPPNPVWRMMGLPNVRWKLPSRNWLIFLSITGSWTAAVLYDRREKKRIQRKWTKLVEHLAAEPLYEHQMPRKLTVYLSAPPADGLPAARDHFNEYVKPILVAAALDWDAVEGRREGDVRAGLAERIRILRGKRGEPREEEPEVGVREIVEASRLRAGIQEWDGPAGDIVIGRHTWKEYVRGLHEGWLGPLHPPASVDLYEPASAPAPEAPEAATATAEEHTSQSLEDDGSSAGPAPDSTLIPDSEPKQADSSLPKKKKKQPPPYLPASAYDTAPLASTCPAALGPSTTIALPHLLGFFNFPIRMYRFLHRRHVADAAGRATAAAALGAYRPYQSAGADGEGELREEAGREWEQQRLLVNEEAEWHKSARKRDDGEGERVWLDGMVVDARIGGRMRRFEISKEEEDRGRDMGVDGGSRSSWLTGWWPAKKEKGLWEGLEDGKD